MTPETAQAESTPFDLIGGEAAVRGLVERFYDLMELDPAYAELRATHGSDLTITRDKLYCSCAAGWAARRTTATVLAIRV